jgi:hypothetical protein
MASSTSPIMRIVFMKGTFEGRFGVARANLHGVPM